METYMETKTLSQSSDESDLLVNKALKEFQESLPITSKCPKCQTNLKIILTANRTVIKCSCMNIYREYIRL